MMKPFIGRRFHSGRQPAILLVGESHYLPRMSTRHLDAATWYAGSAEQLSEIERGWISTAPIVRAACAERFKNKAFSIWRKSFRVINEHGPRHDDFVEVAEDLSFYNFFLRPARTGVSIETTRVDVDVANDAFAHWCHELQPTAIVFLSALARRALRATSVTPPTAVVPHPASQWWYRSSKAYGGKSGRAILAEYIAALSWLR